MSRRGKAAVVVVMLLMVRTVAAQVGGAASGGGFVDPVNGLSLDQAIAQALAREPSLQAIRAEVEAAKGLRRQADLRENPTVAFEQRGEPSGSDRQTMVAVEWPLDLFRRTGRRAVASQEVGAAEQRVADRERLLAADVRARYGDILVAIRELTLLDDLNAAARRQLELLQSRVAEGATPSIERDLVAVELRRLESDRLLQIGRTEAAVFALKPLLGLEADAALAVGDTLQDIVIRESASPAVQPATTQRSDVREAEARLSVAEANVERAQRDGRFDVSLFASYSRMDTGFSQFGFSPAGTPERVHGVFHYVAGGAKVTLPFLDRNQGMLAAARAERSGAAATVQATRLAAGSERAATAARDERAHEAVRLYSGGVVTLARQNLDVVTRSYELGRATVFDVLDERRRLLDVERAYTEALRGAYEARTELRRALGDIR